jgi:hypothetical protein
MYNILDIKQYSGQGAPPYAPEVLLGLLFYAYATGVFSSRKIDKGRNRVGDHPSHRHLGRAIKTNTISPTPSRAS